MIFSQNVKALIMAVIKLMVKNNEVQIHFFWYYE